VLHTPERAGREEHLAPTPVIVAEGECYTVGIVADTETVATKPFPKSDQLVIVDTVLKRLDEPVLNLVACAPGGILIAKGAEAAIGALYGPLSIVDGGFLPRIGSRR